ncbi:protein MAIN-LIKE 2-like [Rutidosis leptorrhynchoides]|uniref:protein MAIN-LIKE 2-like n=1 Tax=Rutidosis leptorrhynchoides TaxID=125765 RepID=UPI003A9958A8
MGEATITLQDVEVLLGLCVDGDPVTGSDGIPQDPRILPEFKALQRARCFVAYLLAECLFCDTRSPHVDLFILTQLENEHVCGSLSWGSAVLTHTYRRLSADAAHFEAKNIDACGLLIQTWAWERISRIRPSFGRDYVAQMLVFPWLRGGGDL